MFIKTPKCGSETIKNILIESKLWKQENIRIWPHVAAETNPETAAKQIANAIKHIENGEIPPNTVERKLGY